MDKLLEQSPRTLSPEAPTLPFSLRPSKPRILDRSAWLLEILKEEVEKQILQQEEYRIVFGSMDVDVDIKSWTEREEWDMKNGEKKQ
ncbi:hypothetical protein CDD80_5478 [Ophiocordyceps camponoti-rufipedis]|uniref:Uncharacterized protein n=1 Tax=Ophiocordyceps camponoti-rufipedis TaxID=2004952 RepID=A0A2C5YU67_9HYPO|nr:hypothetical protein CDD80_5478 [Ophiocordyceps camponoti-rufipedis]